MALMVDVLSNGQLAIDARRLEDDTQGRANLHHFGRQMVTEYLNVALLLRNERREYAEQRGLAAAIGTQEGKDLTLLDLKRQITNGLSLTIAVGQM